MPAGTVTIAQISDLHIRRRDGATFAGRLRAAALSRCIARLNTLSPDFVIVTGDLTQHGYLEEYLHLRELLAELLIPFFLIPGNHDDRDALRNVFSDHQYLFQTSPHISYTIDAGALRVVALDSTEPGKTGGYLDSARLTWLRSCLQALNCPTILAFHHPPFETGVWPVDTYPFENVEALAEIVVGNPHVQRIISGHVHCALAAQWGGTLACTSPTPSSQVLLKGAPQKRRFLAFERAGFLLHVYDDTESLTTRVARFNGRVESLPVPGSG